MNRAIAVVAWLALASCGESMPVDMRLRPDSGPIPDSGERRADASQGMVTVPMGEQEGDLCGAITMTGSIEVPAGETLTICPGSVVTIAPSSTITVRGTLVLAGEAGRRIQLASDARWSGIVVEGTLEARFTDVFDAELAIDGRDGSTVHFDEGTINARTTDNVRLANGGRLDRTRIVGGDSFEASGGTLAMTDSTIDLDHPGESPDCLVISGGGATLDHVRLTGCHCPLHVTRADAAITVTNSVLDGAAYPVMIARATATFTGNAFEGTEADFQDIGGRTATITATIAGNYYGGGAPELDTANASQFGGASDFLTARPAGVGPRN